MTLDSLAEARLTVDIIEAHPPDEPDTRRRASRPASSPVATPDPIRRNLCSEAPRWYHPALADARNT
jgi:hypothetical protein